MAMLGPGGTKIKLRRYDTRLREWKVQLCRLQIVGDGGSPRGTIRGTRALGGGQNPSGSPDPNPRAASLISGRANAAILLVQNLDGSSPNGSAIWEMWHTTLVAGRRNHLCCHQSWNVWASSDAVLAGSGNRPDLADSFLPGVDRRL